MIESRILSARSTAASFLSSFDSTFVLTVTLAVFSVTLPAESVAIYLTVYVPGLLISTALLSTVSFGFLS